MLLAIILAAVGVGLVLVGLKGFSAEGIPFTSGKNLTGSTGKMVGIICIIVGSPIALAGFWMIVMLANVRR